MRCPGPLGSCARVCPFGVLPCLCGVLGHLAHVHRCARFVCCVACAVSWATWLLFTAVPARCVVSRVLSPGPLGSCSPVCPLGVFCSVCGVLGYLAPFSSVSLLGVLLCMCGVLGHLAPVHRCARSVSSAGCAVSWATWALFRGVPALCVVLRVQCPGPLGSCSPMCSLAALCCMCRVLGHLASFHLCARSVCYVAFAVSWATWLLFTSVLAGCVVLCVRCPGPLGPFFAGALARCVVLRMRCPGPGGSCSQVCSPGALCCVCGVLGHLAPVHWCPRSVCCFACALSLATWLLFTGVLARCLLLGVRCTGPLGPFSAVSPLCVWCCVCSVLGHLAPDQRCARSLRCVVCAVSWATWPLFYCVHARCVVLRLRRPGPLGCCSPVCPLGVLCCVCGVLGHLAPFSPVRSLGALCCVCGVLGHLAPVRRCALPVRCVACAVSWVTWLLCTGVPARCAILLVRLCGPGDSCSLLCSVGALCCVCGVLGHLASVFRCACSVRCVVCVRYPLPLGSCSPVCAVRAVRCVCAVSWATWLPFTGVRAPCIVLRVPFPQPLGSCSPGLTQCARASCCVACAMCWATGLLFTGVLARRVVLRVRCPGPLGSCSPMRPLGVLCPLCDVLSHQAPVNRCPRSACCVACVLSWANWLLFTGVPARRVVLCVWCPGPPSSCSPVRTLGVLCCVWGILGQLVPVHRRVCSVCCVVCAVSRAPWLLFSGALARPVVLGARCPRPLGSCAPVCSLGVLCCVLCVRYPGPLGSCSLVCALGVLCCTCGASLRGAHSSIRTAAIRSRQGLGTLRVHTRPSGRRLVRSQQGLGTLPGAHSSILTAALP